MTPTDPRRLKKTRELNRPDILFSLARFEGSGRVFCGSSDAQIHTADLSQEKPEFQAWEAAHRGYVTGLTATSEGQLVSGASDGKLVWWDPSNGEAIREIEAHVKWIRKLTATPDRTRVISVSDDMICRVWNAQDGVLIHELAGHAPRTPHDFPSMLFTAAVSPDGALLATGDKTGRAIVWQLETGKQVGEVTAPILYTWDGKQRLHSIGGIRSLAFSPDSKLLALGGIGTIGNIDHLGALARLEVFDWQSAERTHEFKGDTYNGLIERLEFHPSGAWLCGAGGDHGGFIKFWDLESSKILKQDKAPMHVHDFEFNAAYDRLFAAGHGKVVEWELSPRPQPPRES